MFAVSEALVVWVGACPGDDESAGVNYSHRSPKGNRHMRRVLNGQGRSQDQRKHLRDPVSSLGPRLGHNQAIGAIAHRQCRLIWLILRRRTAEAESLRRIHVFSGLERTGTQISGECVAVNPGPQAEGSLPRPRFLEKKCRLRGSFDLRRCQAVLTYP